MATVYTPTANDFARPWRNVKIVHFPEAASQSFKKGAVVIQGGAGVENQVKTAADNPTAAILGIAAEDASGTTGYKLPVYIAAANAEFIMRTVASDAVDFSDIGTARAVQTEAESDGTIWVVDTTDAGNDAVVILAYIDPVTKKYQTTEGDTQVWALVRFQPAATVWGPGAGV